MAEEYISTPVINYNNAKGNIEKEAWFREILDYLQGMEIEDTLLVYDFSRDGNVKLWMTIDDDEDVRIETDIWVHPEDGNDGQVEFVDRTYVPKTETQTIEETLERLWNHQFTGID